MMRPNQGLAFTLPNSQSVLMKVMKVMMLHKQTKIKMLQKRVGTLMKMCHHNLLCHMLGYPLTMRKRRINVTMSMPTRWDLVHAFVAQDSAVEGVLIAERAVRRGRKLAPC
jgi:hypothetical protein